MDGSAASTENALSVGVTAPQSGQGATSGPVSTASTGLPGPVAIMIDRVGTAMAGVTSVSGSVSTVRARGTAAISFAESVTGGAVRALDGHFHFHVVGAQTVDALIRIEQHQVWFGGDVLQQLNVDQRYSWIREDSAASKSELATLERTFSLMGVPFALSVISAAIDGEGPYSEMIDGVPAQRWSLHVDESRVQAGVFGDPVEDTKVQALPPIPTEVWVDATGRVLRIQQRFPQQNGGGTTDMRFFAYDRPLTIDAPDPTTVYTD